LTLVLNGQHLLQHKGVYLYIYLLTKYQCQYGYREISSISYCIEIENVTAKHQY